MSNEDYKAMLKDELNPILKRLQSLEEGIEVRKSAWVTDQISARVQLQVAAMADKVKNELAEGYSKLGQRIDSFEKTLKNWSAPVTPINSKAVEELGRKIDVLTNRLEVVEAVRIPDIDWLKREMDSAAASTRNWFHKTADWVGEKAQDAWTWCKENKFWTLYVPACLGILALPFFVPMPVLLVAAVIPLSLVAFGDAHWRYLNRPVRAVGADLNRSAIHEDLIRMGVSITMSVLAVAEIATAWPAMAIVIALSAVMLGVMGAWATTPIKQPVAAMATV